MLVQLHQSAAFRYKIEKIRNGETLPGTDWREHMITDAGLDKVAAQGNWGLCFQGVILGENVSPTPVRRDSGAVTFTQSGTTLTASAGFFLAADVGRLFKWGTGEAGAEVYITVFTSSTQVTVNTSATVAAPSIGTIWYVNTAAILTPISGITFSRQNDAAQNFTTGTTSGDTAIVTDQIIHYSTAFVANKTATEIAFSHDTTNASVFDRDSVSPTVGFVIGDQAKITVQLIRRYYPITPQAVANFATGYNSAGNFQIESLNLNGNTIGVAYASASGTFTNGNGCVLEPGTASSTAIGVALSTFNIQAFQTTTMPATTGFTFKTATGVGYGAGTYYKDLTVLFAISEVNGTIYGFCVGSAGTGRIATHKLTATFTKLNTQTLSFTFRKSWSRILNN